MCKDMICLHVQGSLQKDVQPSVLCLDLQRQRPDHCILNIAVVHILGCVELLKAQHCAASQTSPRMIERVHWIG